MTKHWKVDCRISKDTMLIDGYQFDKNGLHISFSEYSTDLKLKISFKPDLDGFKVLYFQNSLEANDRIWNLMQAANVEGPLNPFFLRDDSVFIEEVKKIAGYDAEGVDYLHYTMVTDDFWIDIVSSEPPKITITDRPG